MVDVDFAVSTNTDVGVASGQQYWKRFLKLRLERLKHADVLDNYHITNVSFILTFQIELSFIICCMLEGKCFGHFGGLQKIISDTKSVTNAETPILTAMSA